MKASEDLPPLDGDKRAAERRPEPLEPESLPLSARLLGWLCWRLPYPLKYVLAVLLTALWNTVLPIRQRIARQNLEQALQLPRRAQRRLLWRLGYQLVLNYLEFPAIPAMPLEERIRRFRWRGLAHLDEALSEGRGVLILSAHLGAFELLAAATAARGYPVTIVARKQRSPTGAAILQAWRRAGGLEVLPERGSLKAILRALRAGGLVVMVLDQNMNRDRGVFVEFFGHPACTLDSLARLAMRTGAPVVPAFTWRGADGLHEAEFMPAVALSRTDDLQADVVANTQLFTRLIEAQVRLHPEQWLWLHRRWKTRPAASD